MSYFASNPCVSPGKEPISMLPPEAQSDATPSVTCTTNSLTLDTACMQQPRTPHPTTTPHGNLTRYRCYTVPAFLKQRFPAWAGRCKLWCGVSVWAHPGPPRLLLPQAHSDPTSPQLHIHQRQDEVIMHAPPPQPIPPPANRKRCSGCSGRCKRWCGRCGQRGWSHRCMFLRVMKSSAALASPQSPSPL